MVLVIFFGECNNMNERIIVLQAMQDMLENDLSKKILVPLFKAMYSCKVDFVGGGAEKGRDIIIYKKDEFNDYEIVTVQVKKIKITSNSSKSTSFQQLLTQVEQMGSESVLLPDSHNKQRASKLIFVTPYSINQKELDNHQGAIELSLNSNVKILSGDKIFDLIKKHNPDIFDDLIGNIKKSKIALSQKLNNSALMNALNSKRNDNTVDIYCDVSFEIGGKHVNDYLNNEVEKIIILDSKKISFSQIMFEKEYDSIKLKFNIEILNHEGLKYIENYNLMKRIFKHQILKYSNIIIKIKKYFSSYALPNISDEYYQNYLTVKGLSERNFGANSKNVIELRKIKSIFEELVGSSNKELKNASKSDRIYKKNLVDVRTFSENIGKLITVKIGHYKKVNIVRELDNSFQVEKDFDDLWEKFIELKRTLNEESKSTITIKKYLEYLDDLTFIAKIFSANSNLFKITKTQKQLIPKPPSNNIVDYLDTGRSFSILGEAGSGKTTNLHHYANVLMKRETSKLIIPVTLSEIGGFCSEPTVEGSERLLIGIYKYLLSCHLKISFEEFKTYLKHGNCVLILDSIDEAISSYRWIIESLIELNENYKNTQIITSSRFSIDKAMEIPFAHISLEPFNKKQKNEFFNKWFVGKESYARKIEKHLLIWKELDEVVSNPLSATILCVLCSNEGPLPKTESNLYKSRFDLLSGELDKYKKIRRLKTPSNLLLSYITSFSFYLHSNKRKEFSLNNLKNFIGKNAGETLDDKVDVIVQDLLSAEIICLSGIDKYDFGHFKFQEYLVSVEISHRRDFSARKELYDPWWDEVFILYAQNSSGIDWLFKKAALEADFNKIHKKLRKMVLLRPKIEHNKLYSFLASALESNYSDSWEESDLDVNNWDDFSDIEEPLY